MKVKMLENVQGTDISGVLLYDRITVSVLETGMEYEVGEPLGAWLLEHRKAEALKPEKKLPEKKAKRDYDEEITA